MQKDVKKSSSFPEISLGKRIIFTFLLFLIGLAILLFAEGLLRLFNYGGDLRLFITSTDEVSDYYRCNPDVGERYFYRQFTVPTPPKGLFLKKKPENGYRIFVLGGSTTAGFPYGNNLMFSQILMYKLQDTFPGKRIEVVNTAMAAVNSYTMLDFTDEILEYEPDLILIYMGHNEFYGALGVASLESVGRNRSLIKIYLKVLHLRGFLLLRNIISKVRSIFKADKAKHPEDLTATLMERIVSEQIIPLGSELYEQGMNQFQSNLEEILKQAGQAKIPVVLCELVSNVGNQPPFRSVEQDTFPPAKEVYEKAQQSEERGDYNEACKLYTRAKDLDGLRFRATEDFNTIIHELASGYKTPVVPLKQIFEEKSPNGVIGNELMLEHLHPNLDGHFLIAEGFYQTIRAEGHINSKWDQGRIQTPEEYKRNWGMTALDTVYGNLSIRWLKGGWPFRPKELHNTSLETYVPKNKIDSVALKVLLDMEIGIEVGHLDMAKYYQKHKEYEKAYREYRALIYTIPHETMFYEGAAEMLFKLNREQEAIPILEESLLIRKNAFAIKNLARLYLQQGSVNKSLSYLAKAETELARDKEYLNILAHAYVASGQLDKFRKVIEHLHSQKIGSLQPIQYNVKEHARELADKYNAVSLELIKEKNLFAALVLLNQSLDIKETAKANKWVGQIFLMQKKFKKALPYLRKAETMGLESGDLYYNLAAANYYLNYKNEAVQYLNKLKQIEANYSDPSGLRDKLKQDQSN